MKIRSVQCYEVKWIPYIGRAQHDELEPNLKKSLGLSWTTYNFLPFISKWPKSQFSNLNKIHLEMNGGKLWVVHDRLRLELPESVEILPVTAFNQPTAFKL